MTPQDQRDLLAMRRDLADLRRQMRGIPSRWAAPVAPASSYLWQIVGGQTIPALGTTGIMRAAALITPSTLPDGPAGTGIITVPAWPIPLLLPNGIGVAQRVDLNNSQPAYSFVRIDGSYAGAYGSDDLATGESIFLGTTSIMDKVSGGTTWRYYCLSGVIGYY